MNRIEQQMANAISKGLILFLIVGYWCYSLDSYAMTPAQRRAVLTAAECELRLLDDPKIVVVDAVSGGADIAEAFQRFGQSHPDLARFTGPSALIHVHAGQEFSPHHQASFRPENFSRDLTNDGSEARFQEIVAELRGLQVVRVLAGMDSSVALTDRLNAALGLPGNPPELSSTRRNKDEMQETLRRAGLSSIPTLRTSDVEAALRWVNDRSLNRGGYPVVVKPRNSAGTHGVSICQNEAEVRAAFADIVGQTNVFNEGMEAVLVQSFISGKEYAVNVVSGRAPGRNGVGHFVVEIWEYNKVQRPIGDGRMAPVYDYDRLVSRDEPVARVLTDYVTRALDAFQFREGPTHVEVMVQPDGTPVMIELGGRLMGGHTQQSTRLALGTSPIDEWVRTILDPRGFDRSARAGYPRMLAHARSVSFISDQTGTLTAINRDLLTSLPSMVVEHMALPSVGSRMSQTTSMLNSPGQVWLVHEDAAQVEADYRFIRANERNIFITAPTTPERP